MGAHVARPQPDQSGSTRKRAILNQHSYRAACESAPWRAQAVSCKVEASTFHLHAQVQRPDGLHLLSLGCAPGEFQRAYDELKHSLKTHGVGALPDLRLPSELPAAAMEPMVLEACAQVQGRLDEVDAGLLDAVLDASPTLQSLLGLSSSASPRAARSTPNLMVLVECHQPLLLEIAGYLSDSVADLANFTCLASQLLSQQISFGGASLWESAFSARWPAFHECLAFQPARAQAQEWKDSYRETVSGKREYVLEVFDREKKLGFAMAAMVAEVTYDKDEDGFVASYLSASEVLPETIPADEGHRLRFCPASCRAQLRPQVSVEPDPTHQGRPWCYMYRVLRGHQELSVGQGVELQWKMQLGSPFGWWYGHLEQLRRDPSGKLATATITFPHFLSTSRWYRLEVRFGDAEMRPCSFGGYTGGLRVASAAEREHWMRYFPKEPFAF